jgi:Tol biopolymer transport system component
MKRVAALTMAILGAFCTSPREPVNNASSSQCEFGPGQSLGPLANSPVFDGSPTVSSDETELFFTSARQGQQDLFASTRPSKDGSWSHPQNLGPAVNDPMSDDFSLRLSADGTALYFASTRRGGFGAADMYVATRASRQRPWGPATNLGPRVNTEAFEAFPTPTADGTMLYFNRSTAFDSQDSDIWVTSRTGPEDPWDVPQGVRGGINSERAEFSPSVSTDGNTLYFASERGAGLEMWVSSRTDRSHDWGTPERVRGGVNVPRSMTLAPFISADERSLYFMSARPDANDSRTCTPMTCFDRVDLYVARLQCR